jgi:hypothetical protein
MAILSLHERHLPPFQPQRWSPVDWLLQTLVLA